MRIVSYNVNGLRAALRKDFHLWLRYAKPDVVCLQEVKAFEDQYDVNLFKELGYHVFTHPAQKKGYSGVAIFSKIIPQKVKVGIGIGDYDVEGRLIRADYKNYSIISVYMPSGASKPERQIFKLRWLEDFWKYIEVELEKGRKIFIAGDFNICHQAIDIHNPIGLEGYPGFTESERSWLSGFLNLGFVDSYRHVNSSPHSYTWWSYMGGARDRNLGWRIDYILTPSILKSKIINVRHLVDAKHSDHCPVSLEIDL